MTIKNPAPAATNPVEDRRVQPDGPLSGEVQRGGEATHTPLGSGLAVSDGRGYSAPQRPKAVPTMDCTGWLAVIEGVENGWVVRSWSGPKFTTRAEASAAAIAKATGQ